MWDECRRWRERRDGESWQEARRRMLGEEGEGEAWMRAVLEERDEGEEEETGGWE